MQRSSAEDPSVLTSFLKDEGNNRTDLIEAYDVQSVQHETLFKFLFHSFFESNKPSSGVTSSHLDPFDEFEGEFSDQAKVDVVGEQNTAAENIKQWDGGMTGSTSLLAFLRKEVIWMSSLLIHEKLIEYYSSSYEYELEYFD